MNNFTEIINSYGLSAFASDIGVSANTAKQMRKRDSVAPEYWDALVRGAQRRGLQDVTLEALARIAARHRRGSVCPDSAEAAP